MCGIAGFYCWGDARPPVDVTRALLVDNEKRGKDSAGIAYLLNNAIRVAKDGTRAANFVESIKENRWALIGQSPIVLMHARNKTKGAATDNNNNHPVIGLDWVVTHNGVIRNDDELFEHYGAKRFAEVDTAALPLVLSQGKSYHESLKHVTTLSGDVTAALWNDTDETRNRVALVRLGNNDLFLFMDQENRILYWSSTLSAANIVNGPTVGPLRFTTISHLPEDRAIVLGPEGIELFRLKRNAYNPPRKYTGNFPKGPTTSTLSKSAQTTTCSTSARVGPNKNETVSKFKWDSYEEDPRVRHVKPTPILEDVEGRSAYFLGNVLNQFNMDPRLLRTTLKTGYGNWVFTRIPKSEYIDREFHPHKRVKKYWAQVLQPSLSKDAYDKLLKLPWPKSEADAGKCELDGLLLIENYCEVLTNPNWSNHASQVPGFMCPWCGCHGASAQWQREGFRCWICHIRSTIFGEGEVK